MKKHINKPLPKFLFLIFLVLIIITGCSKKKQESEVEISYPVECETLPVVKGEESSEESHIYRECNLDVHEINDYSYIFANMEMTEESGNTYIFEPDISLEVREVFIVSQESLLNNINELLKEGIDNKGFTFILSKEYMDRCDYQNKTAYVKVSSMQSWKQIIITIQLIEGNEINFGYAYAKANDLAEKNSWAADSVIDISNKTFVEFVKKDPGRLNLVYPCFIEPYSTLEQIEVAKALAVQIYKNTPDVFDEYGFLAGIQTYADENEIPYEETYLRFIKGDRSVPLIIKSLYVEEWITKEFQADAMILMAENPVPDQLNWQKSLSQMILLRKNTDRMIEHVRLLLGIEEENKIIVRYFQWEPELSYRGLTDYSNRLISVSSAYVIAHECIHYLHYMVRPSNYRTRVGFHWCYEALAVYFSWEMEYEQSMFYRDIIHEIRQSRKEFDNETEGRILQKMKEIAMSPKEILLLGENKEDGYYGSYYLIASFLVNEYGESTFAQLMIYPEDSVSLTGFSIEELIDKWERYLYTIYNAEMHI